MIKIESHFCALFLLIQNTVASAAIDLSSDSPLKPSAASASAATPTASSSALPPATPSAAAAAAASASAAASAAEIALRLSLESQLDSTRRDLEHARAAAADADSGTLVLSTTGH